MNGRGVAQSALVPPIGRAAADRALAALLRELGSKLITDRDGCLPYQSDDTGLVGDARAVVLCESTDDIVTTLRIAHDTGLPVTARAGGSGRTGGAVPLGGGVVLATAGMNQIVDIDRQEGVAVVQPGVLLDDLWSAVEREGWFYPPDPNSSWMCCLAGNAAENAAGPRAFKYGATRDYVLGIDTVLPGGERFFSGRRTKKGVTGYDVTALLVGSEGTLASFGDLTLRLVPRPTTIVTLLALFPRWEAAARSVSQTIAAGLTPRCIEFLDGATLRVMRDAGNALDERAGAMLLIETDGEEAEALSQAERIGEICENAGSLPVVVAQSGTQRAKLWSARKQMSAAVRALAAHKLSEDVVVPRTRLGELIAEVERIGDEHDIMTLCYGHAGDGNLHVNFLWDDEEQKRRVDRGIEQLFRRTLSLGGTLSGEHGIGLSKADYLHLEQTPAHLALQRRLKAAFDPRGIMNPGKVLRLGHTGC